MLQTFWDKHPVLYQIIQVVREGQWITHVFEWLFMMVSRLTGYAMTLAIGYLIYYAIEFKHSLDAVIAHPGFADNLASYSNVVINVGPELVFPGVVVLCIRSFTTRRWLDGTLYLVTTILFVTLTMVLLNAFMDNQITASFLAAMLFWRAFASLWYTVVAAYCGGHGGLDLKGLLTELDTLREQLDSGQQRVSTLERDLNNAQQQVSTLRGQVSTVQQEASTLRGQVNREQQRVSSLERELETGHGDTAGLRRELNTARDEAESLRARLDTKTRTVEDMNTEVANVVTLRRELNTAHLTAEALREQLDTKTRELSSVQKALASEQQRVSTLERELSTEQATVSKLQRDLSTEQGRPVSRVSKSTPEQVSTEQAKRSPGQAHRVSIEQNTGTDGQDKIVDLDSRRKTELTEEEIKARIRAMRIDDPNVSGRAIGRALNIAPGTALKYLEQVEQEKQQAANE